MRQTTINEVAKDRNIVNQDVCCMIYVKYLYVNLVKSSFKKALESEKNYGRSYALPS